MKILIAEPKNFSSRAVAALRLAGHRVVLKEHDYKLLQSSIAEYDCLIVRLGLALDERVLRTLGRLKYIVTPTTGTDHIDMKFCAKGGISVISLQGEESFLRTITPTAELTYALILSIYRCLIPAVQGVRRGEWDREKYVGQEIWGKTIGIIGLGRLGSMVARVAEIFGAKVIYFDPFVESKSYQRCRTLGSLARQSDIITLHAPLVDTTQGMINKKFFASCKETAIFINTSRGGIVREDDLLYALRRKQIAGAGLDVLSNEVGKKKLKNPLIDYAKQNSNLIITPHIGGAAVGAMRRTEEFIVDKLIADVKKNKK